MPAPDFELYKRDHGFDKSKELTQFQAGLSEYIQDSLDSDHSAERDALSADVRALFSQETILQDPTMPSPGKTITERRIQKIEKDSIDLFVQVYDELVHDDSFRTITSPPDDSEWDHESIEIAAYAEFCKVIYAEVYQDAQERIKDLRDGAVDSAGERPKPYTEWDSIHNEGSFAELVANTNTYFEEFRISSRAALMFKGLDTASRRNVSNFNDDLWTIANESDLALNTSKFSTIPRIIRKDAKDIRRENPRPKAYNGSEYEKHEELEKKAKNSFELESRMLHIELLVKHLRDSKIANTGLRLDDRTKAVVDAKTAFLLAESTFGLKPRHPETNEELGLVSSLRSRDYSARFLRLRYLIGDLDQMVRKPKQGSFNAILGRGANKSLLTRIRHPQNTVGQGLALLEEAATWYRPE